MSEWMVNPKKRIESLVNAAWNAALDAAAEAILIPDEDHPCDCDECAFIKRILALKKGGTQ